MAQSTFTMPLERQIEVQRPVVELKLPTEAVVLNAPSQEQADAVDNVFAEKSDDRNAAVDAINVLAVGMLLHDIVKDTLAPPANDEDEEEPKARPMEPQPK